MLFSYLKMTQRLLREARQDFVNPQDLTDYVNVARGQVAGRGACIRRFGTLVTTIGQRNYNFSALSLGDASVSGAINVSAITYNSGNGQRWIPVRSWPWFMLYHLNNTAPVNGAPAVWSQYGQGSAGTGSITGIGDGTMSSGSFYIDPPPDVAYTLNCDCACYPAALVEDTDAESLPYLWTDAVPYYAAYQVLLELSRVDDAAKMYEVFKTFVDQARQMANPEVDTFVYRQAQDPVQPSKLGAARGA